MSEEIKQAWSAILAAGVCGGFLGSMLTVLFNHRLTIGRERRSGINADKTKFLMAIDELIDTTNNCNAPNMVRCEIRKRLYESYNRCRLHLKGKRLEAYNAAWEKLKNTTSDETADPSQSKDKIVQSQKLLISRFMALREKIMSI